MSKESVVEVEESSNETVASVASPSMTEAQAKESGLSADEIVAGKKHGLIADKTSKKEVESTDKTEEEEADDQKEVSGETEEVEDAKPADAAEEDLDPEEEQEIVNGYNDNEKSLYWKAKKERLKRQAAQSESEHTKIKLAAAQREIDLLKKGENKTTVEGEEENTESEEDSRVMTVGEFKKMLDDQKKEQGKQNAKAQETIVRLEKQEQDFKIDHPDFDEVMDLAREMMDKKPSLRKMLLLAGADPSENAADVAYDIGRMHPNYKKGGTKDTTSDGSKTKVDKAITNANKRTSSASVTGGGTKKVVSETDLTVEDAASLSPAAYGKLSKATRDRLLRESCE